MPLVLFGEEYSSTAELYELLGITQRTAVILKFLGECQRAQGEMTSAIQSFQLALDIKLKLFVMENVSTADSYDSLGNTQRTRGDLTSALQSFQRSTQVVWKRESKHS